MFKQDCPVTEWVHSRVLRTIPNVKEGLSLPGSFRPRLCFLSGLAWLPTESRSVGRLWVISGLQPWKMTALWWWEIAGISQSFSCHHRCHHRPASSPEDQVSLGHPLQIINELPPFFVQLPRSDQNPTTLTDGHCSSGVYNLPFGLPSSFPVSFHLPIPREKRHTSCHH